jgi:ParB family transcriptional regulator, chromosome partitioning protein
MKSVSETQALQEAAEQVRAAAIQKIPESHKRLRSFTRKGYSGSVDDDNIFEIKKETISNESQGTPFLVAISDIEDSPYQTIPLSKSKVADLVKNLATNPLSSPIVLRRLPNGKLQLIAGRHRVEAYKQLQREEIEATVKKLSDDQAEKLVFYDNLFAPNLSDYEKYLGFAQRKKTKNLTGEQLAEEAGVSTATVSKLLGFSDLPESIHEALRKHPHTIGASNARDFVQLALINEELSITAIEKIAAGEMTQKAALEWIKAGGEKPKKKSVEAIETPIKIGKTRYATVSLRAERLIVNFSSEDEALEMNYVIEKLLQDRAKAIAAK